MSAVENEIYIGSLDAPLFFFSNASIVSASGEYAVDLVGNELSIDRFTPVVRYEYFQTKIYKPTDHDGYMTAGGDGLLATYGNANPAEVPYGTPVWYYSNGELVGKFYVEYVQRVSKNRWKINAVSVIGLLDTQYHRGGVYTGQTFAEVLTEIFGGQIGTSANGITPITGGLADCYVQNEVAITTIHGLLPYDTKRNNLHQLIFAYVVNMIKDADGDLLFFYLKNSEPVEIPTSRIYMEGEVVYETPVTDVELTEYSYVFDDTAELEKVYDNSVSPYISGEDEESLVVFSQPVNPDTIVTSVETMRVRDANEVSAYVTGKGVISAIPYQVEERVLSKSTDIQGIQRTISVDSVTLVNPLNSANLMTKLFEFYTQKQTVKNAIIVEDEKPGKLYSFMNPYNEMSSGFMHRMAFNASSVIKAECEIITNYTPSGVSTNMNNFVLLEEEGTWTVPASVTTIRVFLIAGGQGGHCGYNGGDSRRNPEYPGEGGIGGEGGLGGKVLSLQLDVQEGQTFAYSCGIGGEGGEPYADSTVIENEGGEDLGAGQLGTDTTFGEYSTDNDNAVVINGGIMNLVNGKFYARNGKTGYAGAKGGKGAKSISAYPSQDELAQYSHSGESVTVGDKTWEGGVGAKTLFAAQSGYTGWAYASGGSGAAYGAKGNDGQEGHLQWQAVKGGNGVEGATCPIPGNDAPSYNIGCGGDGGHGGGGGSAPGDSGYSRGNADTGYIGVGGKGSKGGKGAPGGILIYY